MWRSTADTQTNLGGAAALAREAERDPFNDEREEARLVRNEERQCGEAVNLRKCPFRLCAMNRGDGQDEGPHHRLTRSCGKTRTCVRMSSSDRSGWSDSVSRMALTCAAMCTVRSWTPRRKCWLTRDSSSRSVWPSSCTHQPNEWSGKIAGGQNECRTER